MTKHVWVINHYAGAPGYGRGLRHYHLASHWNKQGAKATVFASRRHHLSSRVPAASGLDRTIANVDYVWLDAPGYDGNGLGRLWNMICFSLLLVIRPWHKTLSHSPDTVLVSSPHLFSWISGFVLAKRHGARLIFEVRDIWPLSLVALAGVSKWHPLVMIFGLLERLGYRYSDLVVSNLPYAYEHMESRGMLPDRFRWIPNGVCFDEIDTQFNDQHSLISRLDKLRLDNKFVIFYAGGHGIPNALDQVVDVASLLVGSQDLHFVLVGEGSEKYKLENRVRALNLSNVEFHKTVDKSVINAALQRVDAGLATVQNNPIYRYGVSLNKLFDYMGASVPVVYVVPGRYNPVAEARCGVSVQPGDSVSLASALESLLAMPKCERLALGTNGLEYVRSVHNYRILAESYLNLF